MKSRTPQTEWRQSSRQHGRQLLVDWTAPKITDQFFHNYIVTLAVDRYSEKFVRCFKVIFQSGNETRMNVTSNILQRTFSIRCDTSCGTCFTVDIGNKRYLVTARHIAVGINDKANVEIFHGGQWKLLSAQLVGHGSDNIDISVLAPDQLFGAAHPLEVSTANMILSEDVYFLGFPFGWSSDSADLNAQFPLPLVKKGIISAFSGKDPFILLDGHNNPGFSGGPVVRGNKPDQVIGVISAYRTERRQVLNESGDEAPYTYYTNTGIIIAYDTRQIEQLIEKNPIGINVE